MYTNKFFLIILANVSQESKQAEDVLVLISPISASVLPDKMES